MKQNEELANKGGEHGGFGTEIEDPMLRGVLRDFRGSVHAWSDAAYHRARPASAPMTRRLAWRRVVAWTLGVVMTAGLAGSGLYERRHQQLQAQRAHELEVEQQRILAAKRAEEEARKVEDLLARVDTDVSREVPTAMDPLAQLMTDDGVQ
ncbi:MAG TPA: hypothetical protein VKB38_24680 [Terracidiphilus sp.]|nr:hypothetical protein [Terracidiphilus sp.]